jgi:hypothetical protein
MQIPLSSEATSRIASADGFRIERCQGIGCTALTAALGRRQPRSRTEQQAVGPAIRPTVEPVERGWTMW